MIIMVITINMIFLISSLSPCLIITFVLIIIFGAKHSILIGHFLFSIHFICLIFVAKHSSVIGQGECGGCHSDTHIRLLARIHSHIHRLEMCQKFYTTGFSGQKIYTLKVPKLRLFLLKKKQRKCINLAAFLLEFN